MKIVLVSMPDAVPVDNQAMTVRDLCKITHRVIVRSVAT
jgi:hypothetical protein